MGVIATLPLQLRHVTNPERLCDGSAANYEPVAYAHVLLDMSTSRPLAMQVDEHLDFGSSYDDICIKRSVADQVVWELSCRTNGRGFLVPWPLSLQDRDSVGARAAIDKVRPLLLNPGQEFNLWWTRHIKDLEEVIDSKQRRIRSEKQLVSMSTMFEAREKRKVLRIFEQLEPRFEQLTVSNRRELAQRVENEILRDPAVYNRVLLRIDSSSDFACRQVKGRSFYESAGIDDRERTAGAPSAPAPHADLEEECLQWALYLADHILEAAEFVGRKEVVSKVVHLRRFLDILHHYEAEYKLESRGGFGGWNDVVEMQWRIEQWDFVPGVYSGMLRRLCHSFQDLRESIEDFGRRLRRIYRRALDEASWHFPRELASEWAVRIHEAMAIVDRPQICARAFENGRLAATYEKVLRGEQHAEAGDAVGEFFESVRRVTEQAGAGAGSELFEKLTHWMVLGLDHRILKNPEKVRQYISRLNRYLACLGHTSPDEASIIFDGTEFTIEGIHGEPIKVRSTLKSISKMAAWADRSLKGVNLALAYREFLEDPSFQHQVKLANSAAELADAVHRAEQALKAHFGIDSVALKRLAGSTAFVVAIFEAGEHLDEGNNVAVLGDMLIASGGVIKVLVGDLGLVGVLIAALTLFGILVVYFSLREDGRYVLNFVNNHWKNMQYFGADLDKFLDRSSMLSYVDGFIQREVQ